MNTAATFIAIDVAVAGGSLSLWRGGSEIGFWIGDEHIARAESLLINIDRLLTAHGCEASQMNFVAVSAGPGSFTGIRAGIATATGLARGLNLAVFSVSILEAMIAKHRDQGIRLAAIPMGRNTVNVQSFDPLDYSTRQPPKSVSEDEFISTIDNSARTAVLHESLYERTNRSPTLINAGSNMAAYIGAHCLIDPVSTSPPLFISKSF